MSTKFAQTATNEVKRLDSQNVQVTVTSGPSKGKSYTLFVGKYSGVGQCSCSWSKRNGTTCSHVRDAEAFVKTEQAQPEPKKQSSFEQWLEKAQADGELIFA